uniref:Uncharacterized protein n=1 Tax=Amphimedon queenslandica TaxID=400682 RepID=A0A1X7VTK4_AMPQE
MGATTKGQEGMIRRRKTASGRTTNGVVEARNGTPRRRTATRNGMLRKKNGDDMKSYARRNKIGDESEKRTAYVTRD